MDSLTVVQRVAAEQDGVVTLAQACSAGLTKDDVYRLCRSGRWRRAARGIYFAAGPLVDQPFRGGAGQLSPDSGDIARRARIRAAVLSLGPQAVAVLDTAAHLHNIGGLRPTDTLHISLPGEAARHARPADPAVVVHQFRLAASGVTAVHGIRTTTAQQTIADLILRVDRFSAVCLLDSALNRGLVTPDDFPHIHKLLWRRRGAVAARKYLGEADGRAQSPLETRVRLRCVDGKVAPDVLQQEVRAADGHLVGIGDFAWLRPRLIGEADGAGPHGTPEAVFGDRDRQNAFAGERWQILRFTWQDTLRPDKIPSVVRYTIAQRLVELRLAA